MADIEFLNGTHPGQRVPLQGLRSVLGRHPDCDVVLDQGAVSRQHAQISLIDGDYYVEDLRSRNGTMVNGVLIRDRHKLTNGDHLTICDLELEFHEDVQREDGSAPTGGGLPEIVMSDDEKMAQSTVMLKLDVRSAREPQRLSVKPELKLRAMIEITQSLSQATALDEIFPKVLDSLFNIFLQADRGYVVLVSPEGRLMPRAYKQRKAGEDETARISRTIINEAVKTKHAILSADAASDQRFELSQSIADFRIRSMMCAPLVVGDGEVLGVIQIDTLDQRARFNNEDLDVLAGIASQSAFAIDNARLYDRQIKQQAMQKDLELARKVQKGLLPTAAPSVHGYQFFDFYEPANQVGGDFYDYIELRDGRVAVVLADVSGKGVSAALVMAKLSAEVRYCLASEPTAAKAVDRINETFCRSGWEDRFVTFVLALLDPRENRATIVNAGHMPPFVRRGGGKVELVAEEISGMPLGVAEAFTYDSAELTLAPGEIVTLFTDGISEALNPDNELYTLDRLQGQLANPADSAAVLGMAVLEDVKRHASGRAQSDDMCLVVFGRNA